MAQMEFAARYHAVPAVRSGQDPRMIFMYRDEPFRTSRWLVDESGEVIDSAMFHHHPTPAVRAAEDVVSPVVVGDRAQ